LVDQNNFEINSEDDCEDVIWEGETIRIVEKVKKKFEYEPQKKQEFYTWDNTENMLEVYQLVAGQTQLILNEKEEKVILNELIELTDD